MTPSNPKINKENIKVLIKGKTNHGKVKRGSRSLKSHDSKNEELIRNYINRKIDSASPEVWKGIYDLIELKQDQARKEERERIINIINSLDICMVDGYTGKSYATVDKNKLKELIGK